MFFFNYNVQTYVPTNKLEWCDNDDFWTDVSYSENMFGITIMFMFSCWNNMKNYFLL